MASISESTFRVLAQTRNQIMLVYQRGKSDRKFLLQISMNKKDLSLHLSANEMIGTERQGSKPVTVRQRRIVFAMYLAYKKWRIRGEWLA